MASSEPAGPHPSPNKAVSARVQGENHPILYHDSRSTSRHHTDSLGGEHRQGEGLRGSSSSASRLLRRYMKYIAKGRDIVSLKYGMLHRILY